MKILVTGANGFVGKNLCEALKNIRDGKDRTHPDIRIDDIFMYDINSSADEFEDYCKNADFVFNFAGINRPEISDDFSKGNRDFVSYLIGTLEKYNNTCPVMLSSSIQATLIGRYNGEYGRSKKAGEDILFEYSERTGAKILVYRFTNVFGKWCRPNYNSAVATFCYNKANDLPVHVTDPSIELELLYIDDLVSEMLCALEGREHRCDFDGVSAVFKEDGKYCAPTVTHKVTLGKIVSTLDSFCAQPKTLVMPEIPMGSFEKKLYSTYLSYLPKEKITVDLNMHCDARGSFTELMRTEKCGQFSVNISKPGIKKGEHWHNSKWEIFIVVSGHGLIRQRKIDSDEIIDFEVTGKELKAVQIIPGYTHSIINLSDSEDLVTIMWANEQFDDKKPETYALEVEQ